MCSLYSLEASDQLDSAGRKLIFFGRHTVYGPCVCVLVLSMTVCEVNVWRFWGRTSDKRAGTVVGYFKTIYTYTYDNSAICATKTDRYCLRNSVSPVSRYLWLYTRVNCSFLNRLPAQEINQHSRHWIRLCENLVTYPEPGNYRVRLETDNVHGNAFVHARVKL